MVYQEKQHSLVQFGFNTAEAGLLSALSLKDKVNYLKRELESYELHVIRNHVVSLPYDYWVGGDNKIFSNREMSIKLELDPDERGGYYQKGIQESLRIAKEHPEKIIFLYSPPGPASFESTPNPKYAKPYNIGQLYLMYSPDGNKVSNLSISLDRGGETWLPEIFGKNYLQEVASSADQIDVIRNFITRPYLSNLTIDEFLGKDWEDPDRIVFKSDNLGMEKKYSVNDVMVEITKSLTGGLKPQINAEMIAARVIMNGGSDRRVMEDDLRLAYQMVIGQVMRENGLKEISLGGGCGGSVVKSSDIFGENPVDRLMSVPNLSSAYRGINQVIDSEADYKNDPNLCRCGKPSEAHFHCPGKNESCRHAIIVGAGTRKCPECGAEAICK